MLKLLQLANQSSQLNRVAVGVATKSINSSATHKSLSFLFFGARWQIGGNLHVADFYVGAIFTVKLAAHKTLVVWELAASF